MSEAKPDPPDARGILRWLRRIQPWHAALIWIVLMWPSARWGLPSSRYDRYLFGGNPAWPPERYRATQTLGALRERNAGADTDLNPLADRSQAVEVTRDDCGRFRFLVDRGRAEFDPRFYMNPASDALAGRIALLADFAERWRHVDDVARGQVLLRYRLYSRQPDEMITFRALQRMKPRGLDFDPKMYQYGGAYVYLVGGALGLTSLLGLTRLTGDLNVYLAQPELFGEFYVVARSLSLLFAAGVLLAIFRIAGRAGGRAGGWIALLLVASSPVFMTGALEAKPHLPAACMTLWTIEFALRYLSGARTRDALLVGLAAGLACGLVLTGVAALVTLVAFGVALLIQKRRIGPVIAAGAAAVGVYALTNPYVIVNLLVNRAAITSNLGNSTAMYAFDRLGEGAVRVGELLLESIGGPTLAMALVGSALLLARFRLPFLVVSAAGIAALLLCGAIGAGKPPEFARFLILPALLLCIAGGIGLREVGRRSSLISLLLLLVCMITARGLDYANSFRLDADGIDDSRSAASAWLAARLAGGEAVGILAEPAPYSVPPLDFSSRRVLLLPVTPPEPVDPGALPEWLIFIDDQALGGGPWRQWSKYYQSDWTDPLRRMTHASPIAWANKPAFVYRKIEHQAPQAP